MVRPEQNTLGQQQTQLTQIEPEEPVEDGVVQVLVTTGTNGRSSYHKQDPHDAGQPACGERLRASHTSWTQKPKESIRRSCSPCPSCYPEASLDK
jgi:hypothetical protein